MTITAASLQPMPTQLSGAKFLASRRRALLADEPRVGKTGAAIIAADYVLACRILVVTTASGRAVWRRAFPAWSKTGRSVGVLGVDRGAEGCDVQITSWDAVTRSVPKSRFDLVILDEDHKAKNPETKRAQAAYGRMIEGGAQMLTGGAVVRAEDRCWHLSGTPAPHDLGDMWPRLRASCPDALLQNEARGWPDVLRYDDFRRRYCVIRMKRISRFNKIPVVIGGQNEAELRERIGDFMLRRTQADVGIRPPSYDLLPLIVSATQRKTCDGDMNRAMILAAADAGATKDLEMQLGPLRRLTGAIKAEAVVEAVKDEFAGGLDKIVLMRWHTEVGRILREGLADYGVVSVDGSSTPAEREAAEIAFRADPRIRVMDAQIQAAGEAVDFSAASVLWFVETSFSPKDQAQAALRITNVNQSRNCFVKVVTLEGSIDESVQASLMRLWASIRQVIN